MTHKFQLNEAVRVDLPNLGLHDSPGRVYVRHEQDESTIKPAYDIIVFKTNGVYRCTEDMLRLDPDHISDVQRRESSLDGMNLVNDIDVLKRRIVDLGQTITELQLENARLRKLQAELSDSHDYSK